MPASQETLRFSSVFKNAFDAAFGYAMASDTQQMETTKVTVFGGVQCRDGLLTECAEF